MRWIVGLVIAPLAVAVIIALYGPVTDLIARHDVGTITGAKRAPALQTARDAARGRLITTAAGLFAAGALWFTARNYLLARESQVTDRYTKAIEQLGSEKIDVRIGAIYALERIARDSATDHSTVIEVLAAFIREHPREQWPPPGHNERRYDPWESIPTRRPDVQAAVTVIGRRDNRRDRQRINLRAVDLSGVDLSDADLSGADLSGADLNRAQLIGTNFSDANLYGALLIGANLTRANFSRANLTSADFYRANVSSLGRLDAALRANTFADADFTDATLNDATWPRQLNAPSGWARRSKSDMLRPA